MAPYATRYFLTTEIQLWENIRKAIDNLPEIDLGKDNKGDTILLSCHMLARAVSAVYGLEFRDGYFGSPGFSHSWIVTEKKNIIDVYPVGMLGGVLLIDEFVASMVKLYRTFTPKQTAHRYSTIFESEWFKNSVKKVTKELRRVRTFK